MATFAYRARGGGRLVEGELEAPSAAQAAALLGSRGLLPVSIRLLQAAAAPARGTWRALSLRRRRVALDELMLVSRQLRTLVASSIPVSRAVRGLAQSVANPRLAAALDDIVERLEAGATLGSALARHPDVFPALYVSVVHVGENSGRLPEAFAQIADYLELERDTRRRVGAATRYPSFVLVAIGIAMAIINGYVIPAFAGVFAKFGAELPWQTRLLIGTSDFFVDRWYVIAGLACVAVVALRRWLATPGGRQAWDRWRLRLPVLGPLLRSIYLGRFCQTFAMVLRSGVPLVGGLGIVGQAVGNAHMAARIGEMRAAIERGDSITRTAVASGLFSPVVLQMIAVGEETGAIDTLLAEAAAFYAEESEHLLKMLTAAIEPLLVAAIGAMVLVLALGVFLPLWDLSAVALK